MASSKHRPRRPPVVSQLTYPLPDGSPDPQNMNDCGESCVSSLIAVHRGIDLAPGCLRQALGGSTRTGITTAGDLAWLLNRVNVGAGVDLDSDPAKLRLKVGAGEWVIVLGNYQGPNELHWVILYDYGALAAWFMDPWVGRVRKLRWATFGNLMQGDTVGVKDPNPRL